MPVGKRGKKHSGSLGRLAENVAGRLSESGDRFSAEIACRRENPKFAKYADTLAAELALVIAYFDFPITQDDPTLGSRFVEIAADTVRDPKNNGLSPGVVACKVIDTCRELVSEGDSAWWPPSFQEQRQRLLDRETDPKSERNPQMVEVEQ